MKKLLTSLIIIIYLNVNAQGLRFPDKEFFTVSISADPKASINEKGIDYVGELEYAGKIYTKIGFESFSALQGGYTDIHCGIGANLTSGYFDQIRYYAGTRIACVFRDNGHAINYCLEAGIDYNISDSFFVGLRGTLDKRNDQKVIFNWTAETIPSAFIRIGYKWYFKNR